MPYRNTWKWGRTGGFLVLVAFSSGAFAADFPALSTEISPEHPLFIFRAGAPYGGDTTRYSQFLSEIWAALPESLKPYSALEIDPPGQELVSRHERYISILGALQAAGIPTVIVIADGNPNRFYPLSHLAELLHDFTCVRGVSASGLRFNIYDPLDASDAMEPPRVVRWLVEVIDTAARYGRFVWLPLDEIGWPRIMSNVSCRTLYNKMRECRGYVAPGAAYRGPHTISQTGALMGLWLEGAVDLWGVAPDSNWYADARFDGLSRFGGPGGPEKMPSTLYRAMILNGVMTGATVYAFPAEADLWFGASRRHWDEAIRHTLAETVDKGLIPRQEFVREKAPAAYQLAPAVDAAAFHRNLRDIDGVLDAGLLVHGAYGMERPGQVPEMIPNRGDRYWIPIISPYAAPELQSTFARVVQPGSMATAQDWTNLLEGSARRDGEGSAFVTQVGRGLFVLNTRENEAETQTIHIAEAPAPVRGLAARREGEGIALTWPFREGDVSYKVYKRVLPDPVFAPLASGLDQRRFVEPIIEPDLTVAYAVTALTSEVEPFDATVGYGEYLALSTVESRIAEETVLTPLLTVADATPVAAAEATAPAPVPWWPDYTGVDEAGRAAAEAIVARIESWDSAIAKGDFNGVLDMYSAEYTDPEGWRLEYVRRAWQWFFERYAATRMHRQIRAWDFNTYPADSSVRVQMYCRVTGVAVTDPSGRAADVPISFPISDAADVWVTWTDRDGTWRIIATSPALPNLKELLSYSAGPYDQFRPGPDIFTPRAPQP